MVDNFSCVLFLFGSHFREPQAALDPGLPLCQVSQPSELSCAEPVPSVPVNDVSKPGEIGTAAVELHTAQPSAPEDPVSVIDSILNESSSGNQNDPLLDRYELASEVLCYCHLVGCCQSSGGCVVWHNIGN